MKSAMLFGLICCGSLFLNVRAAHAAFTQDASCVLSCITGSSIQDNDQGSPTTVDEHGPVYFDYENSTREELDRKLADSAALDSLCRKKFNAQAKADGSPDCRYFKH